MKQICNEMGIRYEKFRTFLSELQFERPSRSIEHLIHRRKALKMKRIFREMTHDFTAQVSRGHIFWVVEHLYSNCNHGDKIIKDRTYGQG